jgi:hypothetical protein
VKIHDTQALNLKAQSCVTTKGRPGEMLCRRSFWSALQTHLQGVDWATLTMMTKKRIHAALLS